MIEVKARNFNSHFDFDENPNAKKFNFYFFLQRPTREKFSSILA